MKRFSSTPMATEVGRLVFTAVLLSCFLPTFGQSTLYGPEYPPPKDYTIEPSLHTSDGQLGRAGGRTFTFSNLTLSNTTNVFWAIYPEQAMLSMDGEEYDTDEIMVLDPANTELADGKVVWTGTTYMPFSTGGGVNLQSRFVITVTNNDGSALPLTDPASVGLDPKSGGAVQVTASSMIYKVTLELFVSENGTTWIPHLDYYDSHNHVPSIMAYYSIDFGFWWENDPPKLTTNLGANVDEGDTVLIHQGLLSAEDLESDSTTIYFQLNPDDEMNLPAHGTLSLNGILVGMDDTLSLENLQKDTLIYIHDGSETVYDSISFSLLDSDETKYLAEGDSIFFFILNITPVDDIPIVEINDPISVDEDSTVAITAEYLLATDAENGPEKTIYTLDAVTYDRYPQWGVLKKNGVPLTNGNSFTQADIAAGVITYTQNGSEKTDDRFGFSVEDEFGHLAENTDGGTLFVFEITINPVNDAPKLTKLLTLNMEEGGEGIINNAVLAASDDDNEPDEILFTIDPNASIGDPWWGEVRLDGVPLDDGDYFTMEDINSSKVTFTHDGSENYSDFFGFRLSDNAGAIYYDGSWDVFHFNIEITPVNDPPVVHSPIPDFQLGATETWSYTFPDTVFMDSDPEDVLSYSSNTLGDAALPSWITFTPETRTFTANPGENDFGSLNIIVVAQDLAMETARDTFLLDVRAVGMEPGSRSEGIKVYPNPFTERITVDIAERITDLKQIALYNILGEQVCLQEPVVHGENRLEPTNLPSGLYFVRVDYKEKSIIKKVYKR